MKRALFVFGILALIFIGTKIVEAQSVQSYRVAVHIPSIAGVNVPIDDPNAEIRLSNLPQDLQTDVRQVVRGNESIVLQTVLVR